MGGLRREQGRGRTMAAPRWTDLTATTPCSARGRAAGRTRGAAPADNRVCGAVNPSSGRTGASAARRSRVAAAGGDSSGAAVGAPGRVVGRRLVGGLVRLCRLRVGLAAQSRGIEGAVAADLACGRVELLGEE